MNKQQTKNLIMIAIIMVSVIGVMLLPLQPFLLDMLLSVSISLSIIILITSFIACLLVGVIIEGKERYGLKYAFFIVPLSLIIFYYTLFLFQ